MDARNDSTTSPSATRWSAEGAAVVQRGLRRLAQAGLLSPAERDRLVAKIAALPIRPAR